MTSPQASRPASPSRLPLVLGILATCGALLGVLLLVLGAVGIAGAATPNMRGFNPGQSVVVGDSGMSVYARTDSAREDTACAADGPGGQVGFERPVQAYAVDVTGSDFYEIARSPQDMSPGSYALSCDGTTEALYAGPWAPDTATGGVMGPWGVLGGLLLLGLACVLGIVAAILARRGRQSSQRDQPGGYDQQPWASSGYASPYAAPPPAPPYGSAPTQAYRPTTQQEYPYGAPPARDHAPSDDEESTRERGYGGSWPPPPPH